ncbi:nucleotidyltransferase domain-containing protein [Nodosilinea sp. FACHB-131]|uniref:nucleotidyltransferase family protein n=1 Tax=Cyanophyceae TaxID=3028117 RepID=UPI00168258CC|nr:nucleotidyltransferase domain-containing protein [Nodosilinea sp. FACHB-131]MBD1876729.1 nucleotidyltransferase domain-containing protein [Nodosilinea sp. FACHB-131]
MQIELLQAALRRFCPRHHIKKLSVFGSVLRPDFSTESDVDFLVEFQADHIPGLIRLAGIELELSNLIHFKADFRTFKDLSRYFRDDILRTAVVQYDSAQ